MAFANIGLAEPSTITKTVSAISITRNSSVEYQEILTIGDPESTLGVARVTDQTPASTMFGVVVREAAPLTTLRVSQSTAADLLMTLGDPTSTASIARVINGAPSTEAGLVTRTLSYTGGDTWRVEAGSTAAANYFPVRIVDSSGSGFAPLGLEYPDGSTTSTLAAGGLSYNNSSNNTMRMVGITQPWPVQIVKSYPTRSNVVSTVVSTASTAFYELVSSAAGLAKCVYAFSVTSTAAAPLSVEFLSGTNTVVWAVDIGSGSSGVTGANLAVAPPGALFQTASAANLNLRLGSTGVQVRVSLGIFSE